MSSTNYASHTILSLAKQLGVTPWHIRAWGNLDLTASDDHFISPEIVKAIRIIKQRAPTLFVVMKKLPGRDLKWIASTLNIPPEFTPTSSRNFIISHAQAKQLEMAHEQVSS